MSPVLVSCRECGSQLKIRDPNLAGRKVKCPKCAHAFRLEIPVAETSQAAVGAQRVASPEALPDRSSETDASPSWPDSGEAASVAERLKAQHRQRMRRTLTTAAISAGVLLIGGLIGLWAVQFRPQGPVAPPQVVVDESDSAESSEEAVAAPKEAPAAAPGQPIRLQYIPAGTRIAIHLHPADFWQPGSRAEEFRLCLGPISQFLGTTIRELSKREPTQIAEALFCLIPGERGTAPGLAAVFHFQEDVPRSELLDAIGGRRIEDGSAAYYVAGDRAYLIPDQQTMAVCPADLAGEMVAAITEPNPTSEGIGALLRQTDLTRAVTVVFEPTATKIDAEFLMPKPAIPFLNQFLDWLGPEAETVAWSLQWRQEDIWSELIVRNQGGLQARTVERQLAKQLDKLAEQVLAAVQKMHPAEAGRRQLIGRVPAMTRAVTLSTRTESGPRYVKLTTQLPERAAPNLALGTLLAWDESVRTSPGRPGGSDPMEKPDRASLTERLQRKITVEFNREPLQGAFTFIGNEIKTTIDIDGDALKLAAYTKNMPQTFSLENSPALDVIHTIFQQPMQDKLCLVIDEPRNRLLITTQAAAEQQGLKLYSFPQ